MDVATAACPYCQKVIEPRPRRNRKCPHCREPVVLRQGNLLTTADAQALNQPKAAPQQDEPSADQAPVLARFKMFRSSLTTWESLFAEAAEFASQLGPERLINISHSADGGEGIVTVWYWDGPEWGGVGAPPEPEEGDRS
jgi:hypothetical protein